MITKEQEYDKISNIEWIEMYLDFITIIIFSIGGGILLLVIKWEGKLIEKDVLIVRVIVIRSLNQNWRTIQNELC